MRWGSNRSAYEQVTKENGVTTGGERLAYDPHDEYLSDTGKLEVKILQPGWYYIQVFTREWDENTTNEYALKVTRESYSSAILESYASGPRR